MAEKNDFGVVNFKWLEVRIVLQCVLYLDLFIKKYFVKVINLIQIYDFSYFGYKPSFWLNWVCQEGHWNLDVIN